MKTTVKAAIDRPETSLNRVCLYELHGETPCLIEVRITDEGDLLVRAQRLNPIPGEGEWNIEESESWLKLSAENKDQLLLMLLEGLYKGDPAAVESLQAYLKARGISFDYESWL